MDLDGVGFRLHLDFTLSETPKPSAWPQARTQNPPFDAWARGPHACQQSDLPAYLGWEPQPPVIARDPKNISFLSLFACFDSL